MAGGQRELTTADRLRERFRLSFAQALLLQALAAADGATVAINTLLDACSSFDTGPDVLRVQVCHVRQKVGRDAIITEWGRGYRLSDDGLEKVRGALA